MNNEQEYYAEKIEEAVASLNQNLISINEIINKHQPTINNDRYYTDKELSNLLKVSRRTLQDYRSTGIISYILLSGKVLYKESDVFKLLNDNYCKSYQ